MPRLVLHLLGSPQISVDSDSVILPRRKALALLVYLAVTRRVHARDTLATLLWPEYSQSQARSHLRRVLNSLRRTVGPRWIETDRNTIALAGDADVWTDVDHLHALLAGCRTHGHPADGVCPRCLPPLGQAVALYQDDFLAGFTLPDAPDFDDWQRQQAATLRGACLGALDKLSHGCAIRGEYAAAIAHAQQHLRLDAADEAVHRHLMQLYAYTGQQAAALRQYSQCAKALHAEFGVVPGAATLELRAQICSGSYHFTPHTTHWFGDDSIQPSPQHPSDDPQPETEVNDVAGRTPSHNLPAPTTPFVGRKHELDALGQLLADPAQRLITILGPGGSGKTRLALAAATQLAAVGTQEVYLVPLAPATDANHIVAGIAAAAGVHFVGDFVGDKHSPRQQLLRCLQQRQLLLLLDSFDHLLDQVDLLQVLLEGCPHLRLLVTTRERLHLAGETIFPLGGMPYPTWELPADAGEYDAIQLFLQTAQRACGGASLPPGDMQYAVRICRLVGGMPLGIILAAAWAGVLSAAQIAAELTHSLELLTTTVRDLPERQRSMRAILRYSWEQLAAGERDALMRLSVFRGGFGQDAAQLVAGAALPVLAGLCDKSFVQRTADDRYTVHELLRQYAEQQLLDSGAQEVVAQAHSSYYLDLLRQCEAALAGPGQLAAIAALELDLDNIGAAWRQAVHARRYQLVERALEGLFRWLWMVRNRQYEGRAWLRLAREEWTPAVGEAPYPVYGKILARVLDVQANWLAHPQLARERVAQALAIAEAHTDCAEVAFCQWMLGVACMGYPQHDYKTALAYFHQSMHYYHTSEDQFRVAQLLQDMGHAYHRLWQLDKAAEYQERSFALRREMGDRIGQGYCLSHLGWDAYKAGNLLRAAGCWEQSHAIRSEVGDIQGIANCLFERSLLALTAGNWEQGGQLAQEALSMARSVGSTLHERYALRELDVAASMAACPQILRAPAAAAPASLIALFYVVFGFDEITIQYLRELQHALQVADDEADLAQYMPFAAKLLIKQGRTELATELLALAFRYPEVSVGWVGRLPDVARLRPGLEANLPPVAFHQSWTAGLDLDMQTAVRTLLPLLEQGTGVGA